MSSRAWGRSQGHQGLLDIFSDAIGFECLGILEYFDWTMKINPLCTLQGANIFLTEELKTLKLGDFGCAVKIKAHTTMPGELQVFEMVVIVLVSNGWG